MVEITTAVTKTIGTQSRIVRDAVKVLVDSAHDDALTRGKYEGAINYATNIDTFDHWRNTRNVSQS